MNAYNLNWHLLKCLYNFLFPFALGSNSKFEQETSYINPIDNSLRIEMTSKKYIGQFISIKYSDRINPISGFVIDYNDDWTLLKFNPVDYVIDGYIILRHKNIEGFQRNANEKFKEKVIMLKKQHQPDL